MAMRGEEEPNPKPFFECGDRWVVRFSFLVVVLSAILYGVLEFEGVTDPLLSVLISFGLSSYFPIMRRRYKFFSESFETIRGTGSEREVPYGWITELGWHKGELDPEANLTIKFLEEVGKKYMKREEHEISVPNAWSSDLGTDLASWLRNRLGALGLEIRFKQADFEFGQGMLLKEDENPKIKLGKRWKILLTIAVFVLLAIAFLSSLSLL